MKKDTFKTLKFIAVQNYKKLAITFCLVLLENVLFTLYPLIAGWAINKIIERDIILALSYAFVVLLGWSIGAARRKIDTQVFATIYADLCVKVIIGEKARNSDVSSISARVGLSREFVNFFEEHFPVFFTSLASIFGAFIMLLYLEMYVGICCIIVIVFLWLNLKRFVVKNDRLYFKLNNRIENNVNVIEKSSDYHARRHYDITSLIRIKISNQEAFGYFIIGIIGFLLFGTAIVLLSTNGANAGHIYSVLTYLWTFCMGLDDAPRLLQHFSQLKDISKRVNAEISLNLNDR